MKPTVIGLVGEAAAGKDSVASFLCDCYHFNRVAFADDMKYFYGLQKGYRGNREEIIQQVNRNKNREELISYGMSWRNVDPNIWVKATGLRIREIVQDCLRNRKPPRVVVTDVRFYNELDLIREHFGGVIVRVTAPVNVRIKRMKERGDKWDPSFMEHPSEVFPRHVRADYTVDNGGDFVSTMLSLDKLMFEILYGGRNAK